MDKVIFKCQLCALEFNDASRYRAHAKSDWHIYKLRCRVATPGTVVTPPAEPEPTTGEDQNALPRTLEGKSHDITHDTESDEAEGTEEDQSDLESSGSTQGSDEDDEKPVPQFLAGACLFCDNVCDTLSENLIHMSKCHSFSIPHQDVLAVEPETLVWYLHLVIQAYHECIYCGKRRSTAQGAQQHMADKGHCRVEVEDDIADFYDLDGMASDKPEHDYIHATHPDESSMRLSSGKLLTHRMHTSHREWKRRPAEIDYNSNHQSTENEPNVSNHADQSNMGLLTRKERRGAGLATQLSLLSSADRQSLTHLSTSEQRSALTLRKKQQDKARREIRRAESKVETMGNKNLMKTFKNDVPGRKNG